MSHRIRRLVAAVLATLCIPASHIAGQSAVPPLSPFDITGFIERATVDDPGDLFSGGAVWVNGLRITVPRNTLLQLPARAATWQQLFALAPAPYGPTQTGLARADRPAPPLSYEIRVQGNRVASAGSDEHIAGLVFVTQQSANAGAGFINYIDAATGELRVGGHDRDPSSGARVRLNDPAGRFGRATSPDRRFTIDEDNPTVRAATGYPMCIPRSAADDLCPERNRPKDDAGTHLTVFTMDAPGQGTTDALRMAPFEVGDYVTYSGALVTDDGRAYISAASVIANVGIFTAPGTKPAYIAIDTVVLGVGGVPNPFLPQEAAVRTVIEGFTTDPSAPVDLFAVDVDPCSGAPKYRYYASAGVDQGPPTGAVRGRWRWRPNTIADFLPPARDVLAQAGDGTQPLVNGLVAGRYEAPITEFIFPENLGVGSTPVPSNFQDFPFLVSGSGPYGEGDSPAGVLKQLAPWPGALAPTPAACTESATQRPPLADAGIDQNVAPGQLVTVDGSRSTDPNKPAGPLTFAWSQTAGPAVSLATATAAGASFTAPPLTAGGPLTLEFTVTVSNGALSSTAKVRVNVINLPPPPDIIAISIAEFRIRRSRLTVTATTSSADAVLILDGFGAIDRVQLGSGTGAGTFQIVIVGVNPMPRSVTVRSNLGGIATVPVTVR